MGAGEAVFQEVGMTRVRKQAECGRFCFQGEEERIAKDREARNFIGVKER